MSKFEELLLKLDQLIHKKRMDRDRLSLQMACIDSSIESLMEARSMVAKEVVNEAPKENS